jgi:p-hydroxybenzoate 3-monooxygenase
MRTLRTRVGIVGAGPAGLLLGHLLNREGVDTLIVEDRTRDYVAARQRAGVIEHPTAQLLRDIGAGERLDREGIVHGGIYLQYAGERHHLNFRDLCGGTVTVYAQTEIVKDLVAARLDAGLPLEFGISGTAVEDLTTDQPVLHYIAADGTPTRVLCDVIAGCDGFHGVTRPSIPGPLRTVRERGYPYSWLGILADVAPSTDELIYAHSDRGFALHSLRTPEISRLYLQVPADEPIEAWPDDRIWAELSRRLGVDGWTLHEGPVREKSITPMRSFVSSPMRHGRLFLAGDAAHIVPPTGAKGLNLAMTDVTVLAEALIRWLRAGDPAMADDYERRCLRRIWRATHFSWWMTSMLHLPLDGDPFEIQLQLSQLRHVTSSRAAATALAENYTGLVTA